VARPDSSTPLAWRRSPEWYDHGNPEPSWGPIGSLLQQRDPELYERLLSQDAATFALERQRLRVTDSVTDLRDCRGCAARFAPARPNHHYCSNSCRQAAYRKRGTAA